MQRTSLKVLREQKTWIDFLHGEKFVKKLLQSNCKGKQLWYSDEIGAKITRILSMTSYETHMMVYKDSIVDGSPSISIIQGWCDKSGSNYSSVNQ